MTIRRQPSDFFVEEVLDPAWKQGVFPGGAGGRSGSVGGATHAVFRLTKEGLTTPEAVQRLAKALGVSAGMVAYAGLKDKHARTVQHVSVEMAGRVRVGEVDGLGSGGADGAGGLGGSGERWSAEFIGWAREAIPASAIACNWFEIMVRDLTRAACHAMHDRLAMLIGAAEGRELFSVERDVPDVSDRPDALELWIPNYFGDQRFGSARHGEGFAARLLIDGDFEGALKLLIATPARKDSGARRAFTRLAATKWGDWAVLAEELPRIPERRAIEVLASGGGGSGGSGGAMREAFAALPNFLQQMCVDAYQSHLWNLAAVRCVRQICEQKGIEPLCEEGAFGLMAFGPSELMRSLGEVQIPMPGPDAVVDGLGGEALEAVVQEAGLSLEKLAIPGLRRPRFGGSPRGLVVRVEGLTVAIPERDELAAGPGRFKVRVCFKLPRGAYATVVLRGMGC